MESNYRKKTEYYVGSTGGGRDAFKTVRITVGQQSEYDSDTLTRKTKCFETIRNKIDKSFIQSNFNIKYLIIMTINNEMPSPRNTAAVVHCRHYTTNGHRTGAR